MQISLLFPIIIFLSLASSSFILHSLAFIFLVFLFWWLGFVPPEVGNSSRLFLIVIPFLIYFYLILGHHTHKPYKFVRQPFVWTMFQKQSQWQTPELPNESTFVYLNWHGNEKYGYYIQSAAPSKNGVCCYHIESVLFLWTVHRLIYPRDKFVTKNQNRSLWNHSNGIPKCVSRYWIARHVATKPNYHFLCLPWQLTKAEFWQPNTSRVCIYNKSLALGHLSNKPSELLSFERMLCLESSQLILINTVLK